MKKVNYVFIVFLMLAVNSSCSLWTKRYSPGEYISWYNMEDNGLSIRAMKNGVATIIKYRPLEYDAAICLMNKCDSKRNLKSQINESKRALVFQLSYELPSVGIFDINPNGLIHKTKRMQYLAHQIKNDIFLVSNEIDTIHCQNVIFERTPSDMPFAKFELSFGQKELKENTKIHILNRVIEQAPTIIDLASLNNNLPLIKIKDEIK